MEESSERGLSWMAGANDASPLSRRQFVQRGAVAGGVLLGGGLLAACGESGSGGGAAATGGSTVQKKGGVLRVGISGGGSNDTLNPAKVASYPDNIRTMNLYDLLIELDPDARPIPSLAETMEPNATADQWTIRLRDGVEFHNGKTISADDLIYSLKHLGYWNDIFKPAYGFDPNAMTKLDKRTVRITLDKPFSVFRQSLISTLPCLVPVDYDPAKPVGTGPFKFKSFSPGEQSVFVANPNYWGKGPYVDELHIIDFVDDTARVNALLAGQVDVIDNVPAGQFSAIKGNKSFQVLSLESANWQPMGMRVDQAPFDDVRVRQAFRLVQDRQQLLELAVAGQGVVANDLHNRFDPYYPTDLPQRPYDPDQAKALLKQAGREGLSVELVTSPIQRGVVEMSQVFAQQATKAGINVKVTKLDPTNFFNDQYLKRPFSVDWWIWPIEYLSTVALAELPASPGNATHFDNPRFNALYKQATATLDAQRRGQLTHEMQKISYDEGGFMIPYFPNALDAASTKTVGWGNWKTGVGLNGGNLRLISLAS